MKNFIISINCIFALLSHIVLADTKSDTTPELTKANATGISQQKNNQPDNFFEADYAIRLDAGFTYHAIRLHEDILGDIPSYDDFTLGEYLGLSITKPIANQHFLGTRVDYQRIEGHTLNAFRAIDYYYQWSNNTKVNAFIGAARYDFRTPAYGYTIGFGAYYRKPSWKNLGVSVELQYMDKLARDKLHPDDPDYAWDSFIDVRAITFGMNYYF